MIRRIEIKGYRGFDQFKMEGLGRLNLLVGTNNSGKTSVLEALQLVAAEGDPGTLFRILSRRGEHFLDIPVQPGQLPQQFPQAELDVCHLFNGHELKLGKTFSISVFNANSDRSIIYKVSEVKQETLAMFPPDGDPVGSRLALTVEGKPAPASSLAMIPLTLRDSIRLDTYNVLTRMPRSQRHTMLNCRFIGAESLPIQELVGLWNDVSLKPAEQSTIEALQFLEPKIERIASTGTIIQTGQIGHIARGGFKVKLQGMENPIPIGSLGDGIWRMLALAITISQAKDGFLLVDEIDSGLHYSVMPSMWKFMAKIAKKFNVQVFATTHSQDCIRSLASVCHDAEASSQDEISLQRIERDKSQAVAYTEQEIKVAAKQYIEMR